VPCVVLLLWELQRLHPLPNPLLKLLPRLLPGQHPLLDHLLLLEHLLLLDLQVKLPDVLPVQDYKLLQLHLVQPKLQEHLLKLINTSYKLI
jgi:hypothetical protein